MQRVRPKHAKGGGMEQRTAIVTGGLRGLGRAMALGLARAGCRVVAVGHIATDVAEIEREIAGTPLVDHLLPLVADLRRAEECARIVAAAEARCGPVDILVNNAGLTFTYIDPARYRRPTIQRFWEVADEVVANVIANPGAGANTPGMAEEMRQMSREGRAARLVEPEEMVPPLLYVVSREADRINGWRFDANLWDSRLPPAAAARIAGRPAGFEMHPQPG